MGNSKNPDMTIEEMKKMYDEAVIYIDSCKLAMDNSKKIYLMGIGGLFFIAFLIKITTWYFWAVLTAPCMLAVIGASLIGIKYKCNIATFKAVRVYVEKVAKIPITFFKVLKFIPFIGYVFWIIEMIISAITLITPICLILSYAPLTYYLAHRFYKKRKEAIEPMLKYM